jgi:hypothetical protein
MVCSLGKLMMPSRKLCNDEWLFMIMFMGLILTVMLVANGQTERDSEFLTSEIKLDFCIRHQHHMK